MSRVITRRSMLSKLAAAVTVLTGALQAPVAFAKELGKHLERIRGKVISRADASYELWRSSMVWYLHKPERYPDIIVRSQSGQDVIEAVNHARENGLKVSVRSTGHNPARAVLRDGGVLIDLSHLRDVEIDTVACTAWIEPGIRSEELIALTEQQGLTFPAAHTGIVGLGGYLIGGGLGWNMPEWDLACRSILAAEIVTACGKKIIATPNDHGDLLWAVRGAGPGFFGAVIRYKLQLYPLPTAITKSKYVVSIKKLPTVVKELRKISSAKEKRLEIIAVIGRFAPSTLPPAERELQCAISAIAFAHNRSEAEKLLSPVSRSEIPTMSELKRENVEMTNAELYAGQETDHSSPNRTAVENIWTDDPGGCLLKMAEYMLENPPASPRSFALSAWGINPLQEDKTSCVNSPGKDYFSWYQMAEEPSHIKRNTEWMDTSVALMRPYTKGHYINEIDPLRYPQHVEECFTTDSWEQLAELRTKYDPDSLFWTYLGRDQA